MGLWCIQGLSGNMLSGLIAIDIGDKKLELAKKICANYAINTKFENVDERIREITGGNMADFAIEGTGSSQQCTCVFEMGERQINTYEFISL